MQWAGGDAPFAKPAFFSGSRLFYSGPQWFLNALSGPSRRSSPALFDRAGDRDIIPAGDNAYVGTLPYVFDVGLFNHVSLFVAPARSKTSTPSVANIAPVYYFSGVLNSEWTDDSTWGPEVTGYPINAGDVAINLLVVSSDVTQNHGPGVNVGIIDHNPTTAGNSGLSVSWTITTDNVIVLNNGLTPAEINNSQAVGNNSLTINGSAGLYLSSNVNITNANATGVITISAPMVGPGGITIGGIGTTFLTGDNTFYGATIINSGATLSVGGAHSLGGGGTGPTTGLGTSGITVNAGGTLIFNGVTTDRIKNDAPITLSGGTLNTGGLSEYTAGSVLPGMGALTLTSASAIDLGTGASIIAFADSSGIWAGALKILNWSGSSSGNGIDQIYFGTNTSGLTPTQLSQISFYSDATGTNFLGFGSWAQDGDGEIVPLAPIPEPATWIGGMLTLAAIGFRQRRRFKRRFAAPL